MYVKIRPDGAVGIGKGTEGSAEITLGYGEAHMIAAALDKLAQTARSYKQIYKKTTDVGGGHKIEFERSDAGDITISGDGNSYFCTEAEIRQLSELLKHLPPVEVAPPSDYVQKTKPEGGINLIVKNGGLSMPISLPEAALLKTAVVSSLQSRYYDDNITIGRRTVQVERSSDLKWQIGGNGDVVKFTAFEIDALVAGLHNGMLDVLMDLVKSFGMDKIADIRVKSQIQRIEQEATKLLAEKRGGKSIIRHLTKMSRKILGTSVDAEQRTTDFISLCKYVYADLDPSLHAPLFTLFSDMFVTDLEPE